MLHSPLLINPSADFWRHAAEALLEPDQVLGQRMQAGSRDFSGVQVVVPAFSHAIHWRAGLTQALAARSAPAATSFIAPRINTLAGWLALQTPQPVLDDSQRIMLLYAQLRQHGWLKKMFSARRNTDLLPLAQTLLSLSDELTQALLPAMQLAPDDADARWQAALKQLTPAARSILSDEAQLVWSIWKSQLDDDDKHVRRFARLLALAQPTAGAPALAPLIWLSPVAAEPMEQAFLDVYARHAEVQPVLLDWRGPDVPLLYQTAWPELCDSALPPPSDDLFASSMDVPTLALCPAVSLEDGAVQSAQIVLAWLAQGKQDIAVVAQDRVSARRLRALLERAQVAVADETGWKLSTTRAAAALAAWCEVVTSRGETRALLDLLKSPFLFASMEDKAAVVMQIEWQLRRNNIVGEWRSILTAFDETSSASDCLQAIARQAAVFEGRKSLRGWRICARQLLDALDMRVALQDDTAGQQVLEMLETLGAEQGEQGGNGDQDKESGDLFTFSEWRALLNLQLDTVTFMPPISDRRVVMLPLNGARLRHFDAVLVLGADAQHLPSQPQETLFFSNAVRHELGLPTRQSRQRQQLRDLAELLCSNQEVVLSWQTHVDGEPNPVSPWLERLQLCLARAGMSPLRTWRLPLPEQQLSGMLPSMPTPTAPSLLPTRLSASGYNSLVACPYQFFALRMLRVSVLDELSDMPEKRDYGGWLHEILMTYHDTVRDQRTPLTERDALLAKISAQVFDAAIDQHPVALGYAARWYKVMPAYLRWANEREAQGWYFVLGEEALQHKLDWPGGEIELHGRLDRIDEHTEGDQVERVVLDYKTRTLPSLVTKLKDAEDHQLPFYGLLSGQRLQGAHYVALETYKDQTGDVAAPDFEQRQQDLQQQIVHVFRSVQEGAALPANGVESVCQYCEVRGLCRKGAW
ncbi:ATP-dependent helicase/nuclease subunit B [Herbaspirillum sp. Sphag1AN]|uniref:PD-(D/E)XK nuclease family protein n=1 Tax=unclassified Herbaspirillum TaxID=2624150 RepID=UPI001609907C|nr:MULTISPECIES: PD-(D/E)XK nuclease family protein [unclassified Herbaspirillum]MBB3214147.1 ATP-dependent helicase/nuclease subunit B [Herbaspirillum sp. Sphag1AN]MBB3247301.1 ATP-dependent helicase/nuclease subunit B [Herbaspirillum sp. Sphag64]